ncbi:MAG: hypothetical protein AAB691_02205 [Patescibacteria group bacterium]
MIIHFLSSIVSRLTEKAYAYPRFTGPPADAGGAPIKTVNEALGIIVAVIDLAQVVFWILAAGFGLYAAYLYLFARGDKESVTTARRMLVYTAVSILVALIAYGIPSIIVNFVNLGTP